MSDNIKTLIPIEERNGQQAVNARHLYAWLEIGRDFSHWIKEQIDRCDLVENQDYEVFAKNGVNPQGGRPSTEYALSIDAAKEVSMMSQTEKGKEARRYFIECERIARNPIQSLSRKQLALMVVQAEEEKERLAIENKQMGMEITSLTSKNEIQAETIRQQGKELVESREKVQIYNKTMSSDSLFTATKIADCFGISAKKLNKILEVMKIQYWQSGCFHLYADYKTYKGNRLAEIKPNPYYKTDGTIGTRDSLYWTISGREFLLVEKAEKIKELIPCVKV